MVNTGVDRGAILAYSLTKKNMNWIVKTTVYLIHAVARAYTRKWVFLVFVTIVFVATVLVLARFDLLPDTVTEVASGAQKTHVTLEVSPLVSDAGISVTKTKINNSVKELPLKIEIPAIKLSVTISNPKTTNIEILDKGLLKGAVRYPLSAQLGELGNVIVFGHSSYLPIVYNQAYKTFDGIQKLSKKDKIIVYSTTKKYVYSVDTVTKENTASSAISLKVSRPTLTLSTCNSFGTKSDRFVVTAHLVGSYLLGGISTSR
ncbi:hypothetical protein MNBD_CPR01-45 [hydrothermal vent metagenome]|uniref:Sortase A, LPXTG specific n=1 Tax=hydrothermal vent metagenome TaxID=652676 RepID=A0A3B0ULS2_9ZZZZ